jgi:hypothetical protein
MILLSDHSPPTAMALPAVGMEWVKGAKRTPTMLVVFKLLPRAVVSVFAPDA